MSITIPETVVPNVSAFTIQKTLFELIAPDYNYTVTEKENGDDKYLSRNINFPCVKKQENVFAHVFNNCTDDLKMEKETDESRYNRLLITRNQSNPASDDDVDIDKKIAQIKKEIKDINNITNTRISYNRYMIYKIGSITFEKEDEELNLKINKILNEFSESEYTKNL
jgi:hypothetical protein